MIEEPEADDDFGMGILESASQTRPADIDNDIDDDDVWGEDEDEFVSEVLPAEDEDFEELVDDHEDEIEIDDEDLEAEEEDAFGAGIEVEPPPRKAPRSRRRRPPSRERAREEAPAPAAERSPRPSEPTRPAPRKPAEPPTEPAAKKKYEGIPTWEEAISFLARKPPKVSGGERQQGSGQEGDEGKGQRRGGRGGRGRGQGRRRSNN